jgi:putative SOS response-associated peptidase YedK
MCGRYSLIATVDQLLEEFDLADAGELEARYNIAPSEHIPVIRVREGVRRLDSLKWGLVPSWAKDPEIGHRMINARAETVSEKPSFRAALKRRRCIIPATGFFEWKRDGKKKIPYYFRAKSGPLFGLAGLWEHWEGEDGLLETCTIITTTANTLVGKIHDRMPVILKKSNYSAWLDIGGEITGGVGEVFSPYPEGEIDAYEVSGEVNSPKAEGSNLVEPV